MEREKRKRKTDGRVWEEKRGLRAGGEREKEREKLRNRTRLEFGWIYQVLIIRIQHDMERGDQER